MAAVSVSRAPSRSTSKVTTRKLPTHFREEEGRKRIRFVPLQSAKRFNWIEAKFDDYEIDITAAPAMGPERDAWWSQQFDLVYKAFVPPAVSYIELPPQIKSDNTYGPSELTTREKCLAAVAANNKKALSKFLKARQEHGSSREDLQWAFAIEVAEPLEGGCLIVSLNSDGIGTYSRAAEQLARVVIPTAAELRQYAIAGKAVSA